MFYGSINVHALKKTYDKPLRAGQNVFFFLLTTDLGFLILFVIFQTSLMEI